LIFGVETAVVVVEDPEVEVTIEVEKIPGLGAAAPYNAALVRKM
jgi:hypothetical protein